MPITLYDLTVPVFLRGLATLNSLLEKGRTHAEAAGTDATELLQARLAPDMLTLIGQIQRACDTAKFAAVRIGGVENRSFPDEETNFAELHARIAGTRAFLEAVPRTAIDGRAGETLNVNIGRAAGDDRRDGLCAAVRAAELLLPRRHRLRPPPPQRRAARQARLHRTPRPIAMRQSPVFLFDLDGTLVDSVYQHVLAWKAALDAEGIELSVWRIHRKIGMSGGLFTNQLLRETGLDNIGGERVERLRRAHAEAYKAYRDAIRPLPGARELLAWLTDAGIPWAIATSGRMETAAVNLAALGVDPARTPVVTRDQVRYAKPDPDLFLAAAERLAVPIEAAVVVGDAIWDMLAAVRARALGVGLLSGGYGADELRQAGAIRVFDDPADLLEHIDEVGGRR